MFATLELEGRVFDIEVIRETARQMSQNLGRSGVIEHDDVG